jgi:hypothetical protein
MEDFKMKYIMKKVNIMNFVNIDDFNEELDNRLKHGLAESIEYKIKKVYKNGNVDIEAIYEKGEL